MFYALLEEICSMSIVYMHFVERRKTVSTNVAQTQKEVIYTKGRET